MVSRMKKFLEQVETVRSPFAPFYIIRLAMIRTGTEQSDGTQRSVAGKGVLEKIANDRMYGEAAERISNARASDLPEWPLVYAAPSDPTTVDPVTVLGDVRRQSHGCAAHNQISDAASAALIELWERRKVDLWWRGDVPIHPVPKRQLTAWALSNFVKKLRAGAVATRHTRFYVVGGKAPVHVAAALSFNDNAGEMAIGFAAGFDLIPTLKRAFEELLCVELEVVDLRAITQLGGSPAPGSNTEIAQRRQCQLARRFANLSEIADESFCVPTIERLSPMELIECSGLLGFPVHVGDITDQDIGLPVCRAFFQTEEHNRFFKTLNCAPPV